MSGFSPDDTHHGVAVPPRRILYALTVWILLEVVWLVVLGFHLPRYYSAAHWDLAWVGVDVAETVALMGVVVAARRRHHSFALFASTAGTLFALDAWFDVTTARHGSARGSVLAATTEIPFALFLWWSSHRATKSMNAEKASRGASAK